MNRRQFLHVAVLFLGTTATVADQPSQSREAWSIIEAWIANSYALDSYELEYTSWESGIQPNETVYEKTQRRCIGAEHLNERYFSFGRDETRTDDSRTACISASCIVGDRGFELRCNGVTAELTRSHRELHSRITIPDIRLLGHTRFPTSFRHISLADKFNEIYPPARAFRMRSRGDSTFFIEKPIHTPDVDAVAAWRFDASTLVPQTYSMRILQPSTEKWLLLVDESYEWADMNGIQVPVSILGEHLKSGPTSEGGSQYFSVDFEARIDWKNVNKKIDEAKFQFSSYSSPTKVLKLLESNRPAKEPN